MSSSASVSLQISNTEFQKECVFGDECRRGKPEEDRLKGEYICNWCILYDPIVLGTLVEKLGIEDDHKEKLRAQIAARTITDGQLSDELRSRRTFPCVWRNPIYHGAEWRYRCPQPPPAYCSTTEEKLDNWHKMCAACNKWTRHDDRENDQWKYNKYFDLGETQQLGREYRLPKEAPAQFYLRKEGKYDALSKVIEGEYNQETDDKNKNYYDNPLYNRKKR